MLPNTAKLRNNETVIYRATLHWAVLLGPIIIIIIGLLMFTSKSLQAYAVLAFGIIWGIVSFFNLRNSKIILTDSRLLIEVVTPLKKKYDISLKDIKLFDFQQPSLGAMLNFGKIILMLDGNKKKAFRFISRPAELVKEVHKQTIMYRNR